MRRQNLELHPINTDLGSVFNGVPMCIVVLGGDLCIRRFTPLAEEMLNLVPADVGRPITDIRPSSDFPDFAQAFQEVIHDVLFQEKEVQDGSGRWYSLRLLPYQTLEDRIEGAVMVLVDTDNLKRSEERIKGALGYAESIIETVRWPLLVLDARLRIERANRSFFETFRVSPGDTLGQAISRVGSGQWDIPGLIGRLEDVLAKNLAFTDFEVEREFARIGQRTMLLNGQPIRGDAGRPGSILLAIEDVTERKQLEKRVQERTAQLNETVQELEAFSYSASHDLRSPLRAIRGFADLALVEGGEQLPPAVKSYLERIASSAIRADRLVQDVLSYSRVSRANVRLAPIDLEKLVRDIVQQYPAFQPPKAEVFIETPLLMVTGHEASLIQSATNLLTNATKFVLPGTVPRIRIWTDPVGPQVRIWFEDNGIGIEPTNLVRIFGIFERLHSVKDYEGTGIGLAIVRKSIERMGGSVGAESDLGHGSRFWIQLNGVPG